MKPGRFDYDASGIALVYDRGRDHGPGFVELWMRTVESTLPGDAKVSRILDLGCGTGRFIGGLASHFRAKAVGIDPSHKMLAQARGKHRDTRAAFGTGRAEQVPLSDHSVDLVFISMAFHHFDDPLQAARECRRVLRPGGVVFVRAGTAGQIPSYPYVPFFPEAVPLLYEILAPLPEVRETFEAAGLRTITQGVVVQEVAPTLSAYADKLAAGGDSVLARIPSSALEEGLARLRAHARDADPQPVSEPIDYLAFG